MTGPLEANALLFFPLSISYFSIFIPLIQQTGEISYIDQWEWEE